MHVYGTMYALVVVLVEHVFSCCTIADLINVMHKHTLIHFATGEDDSYQKQ
jgi:hypothetical protein